MNNPKKNVSLLKNISGLDTQEIKIEKSINEMVSLRRGTRSDRKKYYLLNEINYRKRQLDAIRKEKARQNV